MKSKVSKICFDEFSRRLHGRRGLKLPLELRLKTQAPSPPSRAAWIEMFDMNELLRGDMKVAAFTGGVD